MTDLGGGWTEVLDQDVNVASGYESKANWAGPLNIGSPNAGQYSIVNLLAAIHSGTNYTFLNQYPLLNTYSTLSSIPTVPSPQYLQYPLLNTYSTLSSIPTVPSPQYLRAMDAGRGSEDPQQHAPDARRKRRRESGRADRRLCKLPLERYPVVPIGLPERRRDPQLPVLCDRHERGMERGNPCE
jgi:hypothetical protein